MQRVNEWPESRSPVGEAKYDWATIVNGEKWEMTMGEDFFTKPETFRATVGSYGQRKGITIRTAVRKADGKVWVQWTGFRDDATDKQVANHLRLIGRGVKKDLSDLVRS